MRTSQKCLFFLLCYLLSSELYADAEAKVKALFIFNFANYVTWPNEAFLSPSSPIDVCIYGRSEVFNSLKVFEGAIIGNRRLEIEQTEEELKIRDGCHILFVTEEQRVKLPEFWSKIKYHYVLSVGEKSEFADKGGIVGIFRTSDQVKFDINISRAIENGLLLDSDLLALARAIKRHSPK